MAWHPALQSIGTLAPVEGVTLSADAEGTIIRDKAGALIDSHVAMRYKNT